MGITLCAATAGTVFLINLVTTVWATFTYGLKNGGLGTIQDGSCKETARLSLWLHFIINALSTLLLGASNYSMQCLASPTREEVDKAHHQHVWLDIGVPSVRNLNYIARYRIILWWLLFISSVPLHLLYNSAVFSTLSSQEYSAYLSSPDLVGQKVFNWSTPVNISYWRYGESLTFGGLTWQKLDNAACIRAYGQEFTSAHRDVVAIVNDSSTLIEYAGTQNWICGGCDSGSILKNASATSNWTVSNRVIQYCLSQPVEEHCRVQFSVVIMAIVIVCNLLKTLCMLLALRKQKLQPLVTLGDGIEDFLAKPDETTCLACLSGKNSFSSGRWGDGPSRWENKGHRWFSSLSTYRWFVCNAL